jgi:cell division protein FtsW (lipid II flippase)
MRFALMPTGNGLQALERERKFYFALLVFITVTLLIVFDKLAGETYAEIVIWIAGLFMAGNVGEHAAKALSSRAPQGTK